MSKKIIVGNWKLYIESTDEAKKYASSLRRRLSQVNGVEVVLAPTFPLIPIVATATKGSAIKVAAQTVSSHQKGAYTGSVSAQTLKNVGATHVLIGHSERRVAENDEMIHAELMAAVSAGLTVILCVGERERDVGGSHFSYIAAQLSSALKNPPAGGHAFPKNIANKLIIAYEPVWAIGKSAEYAMKPAEVQEMVIFIRKTLAESLDRAAALKIPVLYGAAVEPSNAKSLMKEGKVSGLLVGHASANLDEFVEIVKSIS